jgi:hypothetical protein
MKGKEEKFRNDSKDIKAKIDRRTRLLVFQIIKTAHKLKRDFMEMEKEITE